MQLLNRNPKHRLGAQRGAQDLKEHAFFTCIDWIALAARQVTPPFKPYVECDESVANFDPEFTDADILKVAPFDEDPFYSDEADGSLNDTSGELSRSQSLQKRNPNGAAAGAGGVAIGKARPGTRRAQGGSPLTRSVQDAFAGFSFVAGESGDEGDLPHRGGGRVEALDDDDDDDTELNGERLARQGQRSDVDVRMVPVTPEPLNSDVQMR
jgi:hypothetical protein